MTYKEAEERFPGFRAYCREQFIGNECDSDEYRETQPAKGLGMIADWAHVKGTFGYEQAETEMLRLVRDWINAMIGAHEGDHTAESWLYAYAGAEELRPVLGIYFDTLWELDRHPYEHEVELLLEWYGLDRGT